MINKTNINHGIFALVIQLVLAPLAWLVVNDIQIALLLSGTAASAAFIGREYGQVENKVKNRTGRTLSQMMPWHVFRPGLWTLDHYMDMVFPIVGNIAIVLIAPVVLQLVGGL